MSHLADGIIGNFDQRGEVRKRTDFTQWTWILILALALTGPGSPFTALNLDFPCVTWDKNSCLSDGEEVNEISCKKHKAQCLA